MLQNAIVEQPGARLRVAVGIATVGRSGVLSETVGLLASQNRLPDQIVICAVNPSDVDMTCIDAFPVAVEVLFSPAGLPVQRNRILAACSTADVIVFFDDDFFADAKYLSEVERIFLTRPKLVALTGAVIADGINGPGISPEAALELLFKVDYSRIRDDITPIAGAYGCNMAFRLDPTRANGIEFDENLPLYGWQEDVDFSRRVAPYGVIAKCGRLLGVHLGTKGGRTSGVRLGYSQVANLVYLVRKGSVSIGYAMKMISRNVLANFFRLLAPEPWIDRRGRCRGNLMAILDFVRGRDDPRKILKL